MHTVLPANSSNGHSIADSIYFTLRKNIVNLKLKPGESLNAKTIAEKLGVSRTPVRDAFIHLEKEGLIEVVPQVGSSVSKIDLKRVDEEKFIRESLEEKALELFIPNAQESVLSRMEANVQGQRVYAEKNDCLAFLELDDSFHAAIFLAADKAMSWELIQSMSGHYRRVRIMSLWDTAILNKVMLQHEQILKKIQEKDLSAVHTLLRDHFINIVSVEQKLLQSYPDYFKKVQNEDFLMRDFLSLL